MANNLIARLNDERHRLGSFTKLARRLDVTPQQVRSTLTESQPVRWEMACAIWARCPGLLPDLLNYMSDYWAEGHREREAERNGEEGDG